MAVTSDALIVLRFRDIEVASGETIRLHRRSITQHGSCWWGWLSRQHERNPHTEVNALARATKSSFPVALYDTGHGRVYMANCVEVKAFIAELRSPRLDLTPEYYRSRPAQAWFRFTDISDADESALVGKTCTGLPSASDECETDILNSVVQNLRQLRRQEVTMWILT